MQKTSSVWDTIVVGGGIIGTCTAYHSQKLGMKTLMLDQYPLKHSNGSSHGMSRVIRMVHADGAYIPVVKDSYDQIEALEKKRNERLWNNCGLLWFSTKREINSTVTMLKKYDFKFDVLDNKQIAEKFPQFDYDDTWNAIYDPKGGVLYADKWMDAFQDEYRQLGGLYVNRKVLSYTANDDTVSISTSNGTLHTKKVVFALGTWIQEFMPEIRKLAGVQPQAMAVTYWKTKDINDTHYFTPEECPVMIVHNKYTKEDVFGMPCVDYPHAFKFTNCSGDNYDVRSFPEKPSAELITNPANHLREHCKMVDTSKPAVLESCKYTMSSDRHYVIDFHPQHKNVLIGGCMSGSGFKVSPAVGKALAYMAAGKESPVDVNFFKLSRFPNKKRQEK